MTMKAIESCRRFAAKGALFALLAALPAVSAPAADWPMFRGNAARTGYAAEQAAPPFSPAWTFQAGDGILSSPAVYDGVVYFGSRDRYVYALDAATGALRWRFKARNWVDSSPCVSSGTVYAVSTDGHLYALDRLTGALRWFASLNSTSVSSPLVYGGKVYVGTSLPEKKLKVFDAFSGAWLKDVSATQPVEAAPAGYGGNVYFGANDGWVYALDGATLLPPAGWSDYTTVGSFRTNAVAVSSGVIYALPGHDEKKVYALDAVTGSKLRWSDPLNAVVSWQTFTSPVAAGSRLYFAGGIGATNAAAAGSNYLSAVDTGTLASVWPSSPTLGGLSNMGLLSSPAMAGELLYAGTTDGWLKVVSSGAAAAASLALSSAAYSSPAVSGGRVFIGDMSGRLSAFSAGRTASLASAGDGNIFSGLAAVRGSVADVPLAGYTLAYSSGGSPEVWHEMISSATAAPVDRGVLAYWDTTLLANGEYTLKLSVASGGAQPYANTALLQARVNSVPLPPTGLGASDVDADGGNALLLSWTPSVSAGVTHYRIYRDEGGGFALLVSTPAAYSAYTDAFAVTGTTYTYALRAYDGWLESALSASTAAFSVNNSADGTAPAVITDLAAAPGSYGGSLRLSWTAPGNDGNIGTASHYLVRCSTDPAYDGTDFSDPALKAYTIPVEGPAGDSHSSEVGGLRGGTVYFCAVKTADFVPLYSLPSATAAAAAMSDPFPPLPPADLSVIDTPGDEGGSLSLSWTLSPDDGAGAGDVYGYKIYRSTRSGSFPAEPYALRDPGVASYKDTGATENWNFYYAVAAYDSTSDSALSAEAGAMSADNYRVIDALAGGQVRLPDGARVELSPGAIDQDDSVLMTRLDPVTYQALARVSAAANATGIVYKVALRNPNTAITGRALVTLPYTDAEVAGMEPENLRVYSLYDGAWKMLNTSSVDQAAKKVSAEVSSFTIFGLLEYVPSGGLFSPDEVYTYPNPATGETVTFKFRLAHKAFVKIDVYNVAGEKVAALEKADCPAGQASELVWRVRNVASGVYVYRVRAESAAGSKTIIKKLAVIH